MSEKFMPSSRGKTGTKKVNEWFKESLIPSIGKMGNQRHLGAIRDSFGTMIPLIIAGSIGVLVNAIIFGGAGSGYVSVLGLIAKAVNPDMSWESIGSNLIGNLETGWGQTSRIMGFAFGSISTVTVGMMSIWFSFLFGYYIAVSRGFSNPIIAGMVSTASFILAGMGEITFFMDAKGLITAIIFGLISTELFIKLSSVRALNIKLPDGVPPAVGKSFAVFLPVVITFAVIAGINIIVFAPAIVLKDLYVQTGKFQTITGDDVNKLLEAIRNANIAIPEFEKYADLLAKLQASAIDANSFKAFIEGLNGTDKSVVASFIAIVNGSTSLGNAAGNIVQIASSSNIKLTLVNDQLIVSLSWQAIQLTYQQFGMGAAIYQFITSWFITFATGDGALGLAIVFVLFVGIFWFFGIHGSNLMAGIFEPIFWMVLGINSAIVAQAGSYEIAAATGSMGVFTKPFFDAYMYVGGSGATLGLLTMTLAFSKRQELKEVAKYATPAGVFQINEPAIFGYPIILNPVYAIPFIFAPIANLMVGWIFSPAVLGFVNYSTVAAPWTAPWFVTAVITSLDIRALIPAIIVFGLDMLIYLPFVLLDNKLYFKKLKLNNPDQYDVEMKYFNDPEYRFNYDTNRKVEGLKNKGELAIADAMEINAFWKKRMTDAEKLEMRKQESMNKALEKQKIYNEKAQALEKKRALKAQMLKPKWDEHKAKKANKN
ncbi:PTS sugar transporter subunit IIC [Mesoplasma seiffertii]|uniref:PTS sugar transporter subunit IIC n=1 Tax=Mesoplasma seiffertii TaxID=28224 RepID=UPI0006862DEF|nr:PTS transporter subunit EIIC [Mesoplasma seiffertii]